MIRVLLLAAFTFCVVSTIFAPTQKQPASALCTRTHALDNAKEQILFTRTFDRSVQRISVLLRAADLFEERLKEELDIPVFHDDQRQLAE
jgi:hypothetical protein